MGGGGCRGVNIEGGRPVSREGGRMQGCEHRRREAGLGEAWI
jgi:hypothetical protein